MSRSDNGQPSTLLMSECKDKMGFFINLTDEVVQRILALRILALAEDCDDLKKVDEVDALKKVRNFWRHYDNTVIIFCHSPRNF